jgi:ubiquinol-cytochrome c reductase cytochrome c1 subunit
MATRVRLAALAAVLALVLALPAAVRAEGEGTLRHAENDVRNRASLQRGARNFMNYCSGCHSAQFMRFNRIGADLGITDAELKDSLMFTAERPFEPIRSALAPADGAKWFGNAPPDLSLIARSRSPDYLYTFLTGFYLDPSRPTGVNNEALPGTAMPDVLADLQGLQTAVFKPLVAGEATPEIESLKLSSPGTLSPKNFEEFARDTVNFLEYVGEPVQVQRRDLGVWVVLFLMVFTGFAFLLKREYFRDIH